MTNITNAILSSKEYSYWSSNYSVGSFWKNSNFEWFRSIPSPRTKGKVGEEIVELCMKNLGHLVEKPKNKDHDRIINGYKVEIKTSTTWNDILNRFTWQQIRQNDDFERIIFLGINPNDTKMYWATYDDLVKNLFCNDKYRQHKGASGGQDMFWIQNTDKLDWFSEMENF